MKRYYVHNFLLGDPILIDTKEKTWVLYNHNIHGQIYNLEDKPEKINNAKINGLIKRLNSENYSLDNSYCVDRYIYYYILTEEQRNICRRTPYSINNELLAEGDNLIEVLSNTCEWVFENKYTWSKDKKEEDRIENREYYHSILNKNIA